MNPRLVIVGLLGAALAVYSMVYVGIDSVVAAALAVGWAGFALFCACSLALFLFLGPAWQVLVPGAPWRAFFWGRMVRDSAAEVLPFTQFGGFVAGARAAIIHGMTPAMAAASMTVDITTEMIAQVLYIALGLGIIVARAPHSSTIASLTESVFVGLVLLSTGGGVFFFLQRRSLWVATIAARRFSGLLTHAGAIAAALGSIHRAPVRMAASVAIHFGGWIASGAAGWVAFRLIGADVDLPSVLAIESIVYAVRSAAVVVPNALGVQEAAYALLAPLLGIPPEIALAVSLVKRARDIAIGVPILALWQATEGHRALAAE